MALDAKQQIFEAVKKHRSILVATRRDWTGDGLAGALALAAWLRKEGKQVDLICPDFKPVPALAFLPLGQIQNHLANLQKFVISVKTTRSPIGEFYYDRESDQLNIYLTPKEGQFQPEDVTTRLADFRYDLIILVNTPDLEALGEMYQKQTQFFHQTPKINIDHNPANERYGDINLVDVARPATSEIIWDLIKSYNEKIIDEDMATTLLAGIILATKNFKTSRVTPQTLSIASLLVLSGARREQIIQNLYQSRYLSTLKLWGRILSRLTGEADGRLVWSIVSQNDFLETGASREEVADVIEELIASMSRTEVIVIFYELADKNVECLVYTDKNSDSLTVSRKFQPQGNADLARFTIKDMTLAETQKSVIEEIKEKIK